MKKRIISSFLAALLLLAMSVTLLAGCDFFAQGEEKPSGEEKEAVSQGADKEDAAAEENHIAGDMSEQPAAETGENDPEETLAPLPSLDDLSDEEKEMLKQVYIACRVPKEYPEEDADFYAACSELTAFYGIYEGAYAVVFIDKYCFHAFRTVYVEGQTFCFRDYTPLFLCKDGALYTLIEASEAGLISAESFAALRAVHKAYNEDCYKRL